MVDFRASLFQKSLKWGEYHLFFFKHLGSTSTDQPIVESLHDYMYYGDRQPTPPNVLPPEMQV